MKRIGERIHTKRKQLNLQLNDLAKKVGISPSALSQIEKAKAFPSIVTLKSIADNLHTTVGELIGENEAFTKNPVVYKKDVVFIERNESGTEVFMIGHHDLNKQMDSYLVRFAPGSDMLNLLASNTGQIFFYIVSGELNFWLDSSSYELKVGDSVHFNSKAIFTAINKSKDSCEILWVISTVGF